LLEPPLEPSIHSKLGKTEPLGLTFNGPRINFALFASHATEASICLFWSSKPEPDREIPLYGPDHGIWHVELEGVPLNASYAVRIDGKELLSDPYARSFSSVVAWGDFAATRRPFLCRIQPLPPFDWQGVPHPRIPIDELVIYEMHIRGFTAHSASQVKAPGTYLGVVEKIPYLKQLGVNAVELMPVFEFDETHSTKIYLASPQPRINYWGYNHISFFIPMSRYASRPEMAVNEFKLMVRELHRAGIEVLLDVVYNHTGEGTDYNVSFRGIDKRAYFMLDEQGQDLNFSGCGNTFQANSEYGQKIILDSLRYWIEEMKVDGFRFDLAAILSRGVNGHPLADPPILKAIAADPIISSAKLIAEPWDAAGLNQIVQFPKWGPWSVWNGSFRDHVRRFIKGTDHEISAFATVLSGSEGYGFSPTPQTSINFVTAHDGFCLRDLVSYQHKHNIENGESNTDGSDQNYSWNCGAEGPTQDLKIHELRERQMRNFWLTLLLAQGVPMILMGDEIGHTRKGNNNPYVQDNEINWFDWHLCQTNLAMLRFVSSLIHFRKKHPLLRKKQFLKTTDIEWHGHAPHHPDWKSPIRFLAFSLKGEHLLYAAFNADYRPATIFFPPLPNEQKWRLVVNTADSWEKQNFDEPEKGALLGPSIEMAPYSALIALSG
jgi:isoamylase